MTKHPRTAANTRYAFASVIAILAAFLLFIIVMLLPLGLTVGTQVGLIRFPLHTIVLFAVLGGTFFVRVAYLHRKSGA